MLESGARRLLFLDLLLMVGFLGLLSLVFDLHEAYFISEFFIFIILLIGAVIGFIGICRDFPWGYPVLGLTGGIALLNMVILYSFNPVTTPTYALATLALAFVFIFSIMHIRVFLPLDLPPAKPKEELTAGRRSIETTFTPGKFVASATGTAYHLPTCEWAKKIKKKNQVWFSDREEARKQGYKAHECV